MGYLHKIPSPPPRNFRGKLSRFEKCTNVMRYTWYKATHQYLSHFAIYSSTPIFNIPSNIFRAFRQSASQPVHIYLNSNQHATVLYAGKGNALDNSGVERRTSLIGNGATLRLRPSSFLCYQKKRCFLFSLRDNTSRSQRPMLDTNPPTGQETARV